MIDITLQNNITNVSLQVGDSAYYVPDPSQTALGGFNRSTIDPVEIGTIINIDLDNNIIRVDADGMIIPAANDFIMFAKDSSINISGLTGYFAEVDIRNNSEDKAEIYCIASEISVSSK